MISYIIRRILTAIPLMLGITILSFAIIKAAPGGPTSLLMDPNTKPEDRVKFEEKYGLNDPIYIQYGKWLGNMVKGDFGTSLIRRGVPVSEMILNRLPNTLLLMVASTILAFLIAVPLGIFSAMRPYTKLDYTVTVTSFLGVATPNFWLGIMLIILFGVQLGWFPTGGVATLNAPFSIWDRLHHLIMPAFVLAVADMAALTRYTRSSMMEVLQQDYIRTAKSKGFKERTVVLKHGLRNGLIPIITMFGLMLPNFIAGAAITETVFSWPGIGRLFIESAFTRDYPVIMAVTVLTAVFVVIGNLLADILYAIFDPRIEY
ncbi:oligopeptide transport system permease protein AppB [Siminovitchia terrae]|uniref:Oligopeptide transport system permease protein AppB n=1 Tax=Siminovitchia terrae TaxID=1914933 RepID=A0ABQ4KV21_SIMTE|nr:ABC transporter permease [Siminovitchia terrae]GIN89068.1 oligopeptide transport system permease protein AppB [Siminovitchia terrae]GIN95137.1 oligopeptide transport system permease protein AppB [Siminovitchia terrae]